MKTADTNQFALDMKELMRGWTVIEATAKRQFPKINPEQRYELCKGAMNHAFGRKAEK